MGLHIIDERNSTLKDTSYDEDNKVYMVDCELEVCSFDDVKEWYVKNRIPLAKPNPKSNDALFFDKEEGFFIEFKNGKINNAVNFELNKKIYDSLLMLFDLGYVDSNGREVDSISYTRENMNYILVYNEEKYLQVGATRQTKEGFDRQKVEVTASKHRDLLFSTVKKLANDELIKFGLDQFRNYLFKNVHTYTVKEFEENFINKYYVKE